MKKRNGLISTTAALALSSFLIASPLAYAKPDGPRMHRGHAGGEHHQVMRSMMKNLSLNEEQKQLLSQSKRPDRVHNEQLRDLRKQLHQLSLSDGYSETLAADLSQQIAALVEQETLKRANARQQFYASLSDEQKASLADMHVSRSERPQRRRR